MARAVLSPSKLGLEGGGEELACAHALERWAPVAAQRILSLRPEDSGSAIALAEFYDEAYVGSWVIPSGARAPPFDGWG